MSLRGAARRLLDPWAGLVLAALIVLGVVILLATPGPWRAIGEADAPVGLSPVSPSDVAVFVLAGSADAPCTAVVWMHVETAEAALTATLVPGETRCPVAGGGYAPVSRLVTDLDPQAAADALGEALDVRFAGWAVVDRGGLTRLFAAALAQGEEKEGRSDFRAAMTAFSVCAADAAGLARQRDALLGVLRALPYGQLKDNAVVNYVLGSDDVVTDLDLRKTTVLVGALHTLAEEDIAVGVTAVVVESCGPATSWRLDRSRLESLRLSLALGVAPPPTPPLLTVKEREPEVLVVTPAAPDRDVFAADLRTALVDGGALPVTVRAAAAVGASGAAAQLAALVRESRPLAVIVVPAAAMDEQAAAELEQMVAVLRVADQPCVVAGSTVAWGDDLRGAVAAGGVPVVETGADSTSPPSSTSGTLFGAAGTRRDAARLVAATVARACWPGYLAPRLLGTRLGFSYAARRGVEVGLAGRAGRELAPWLVACGFPSREVGDGGWPAPGRPAVVYEPDHRRAALTVAGDLAWGEAALVREPAAPAPVTVVWPRD